MFPLLRNGERYAAEIHFVHRNLQTNEIAVLGFVTSDRNGLNDTNNTPAPEWIEYFAAARSLLQTNQSTITRLNLSSLLGNNRADFWRYSGSLTTPPCTEGIIWTVFRTPILFREADLEDFRNIFRETYRTPQPLYNREIFRSFREEMLSSVPDFNACPRDANKATSGLFSSTLIVFISFLFLACDIFFVAL